MSSVSLYCSAKIVVKVATGIAFITTGTASIRGSLVMNGLSAKYIIIGITNNLKIHIIYILQLFHSFLNSIPDRIAPMIIMDSGVVIEPNISKVPYNTWG